MFVPWRLRFSSAIATMMRAKCYRVSRAVKGLSLSRRPRRSNGGMKEIGSLILSNDHSL